MCLPLTFFLCRPELYKAWGFPAPVSDFLRNPEQTHMVSHPNQPVSSKQNLSHFLKIHIKFQPWILAYHINSYKFRSSKKSSQSFPSFPSFHHFPPHSYVQELFAGRRQQPGFTCRSSLSLKLRYCQKIRNMYNIYIYIYVYIYIWVYI